MEESRSFLPSASARERQPVKIDPITSARPSNRELGNGINQVHACFEAHKEEQARALRKLKEEIGGIRGALGIDGPKKRVSGLTSPRGAFMRTFGATTASIGGVIVIWKLLATVAPTVAVLFTVLNDAIMHGKI